MAGFLQPQQGRVEHRANGAGINPAISMAAHRVVDRAVVHAGAAADAAQHLLKLCPQQVGAPIVEQHDVKFFRPVRVAGAARAGGKCRVGADFLSRGRARQHPDNGAGVFQGRHDFFQARQHHMHARQSLGQIAIALVGDDDRGAGLSHQEIGPGDAHIGANILLAQHGPRLIDQRFALVEVAAGGQIGVVGAKFSLDLGFADMGRRRDDVAGRLAAQLDDVFTQIGFHHLHAHCFEVGVEGDLF